MMNSLHFSQLSRENIKMEIKKYKYLSENVGVNRFRSRVNEFSRNIQPRQENSIKRRVEISEIVFQRCFGGFQYFRFLS